MAGTGGGAVPVPGAAAAQMTAPVIVIPEVPDIHVLAQVLGTPGGIAAALADVYGHMRGLGNSMSDVMAAHTSTNNNDDSNSISTTLRICYIVST